MKLAKCLAAKVALTLALATSMMAPAHAGIPVIDASNVVQTTISAIESKYQSFVQDSQFGKQIEQYAKQIEQYEKQIDQYTRQGLQYAKQLEQFQNMLQNTAAPAAYIWDQAQSTINGLMNTVNTLDYYKSKLGSMDKYLGKFQDLNYYRSSPCFKAGGCTQAQRDAIEQNQYLASEAQKMSGDSLFKVIEEQQASLRRDADKLKEIQDGAQGAKGRMEALAFANQFANQQANQLLQMRALLIAQQNALAVKMQADADREAQWNATRKVMTESRFVPTSEPEDWFGKLGKPK